MSIEIQFPRFDPQTCLAVIKQGHVIILEDVGKIWDYNPAADTMTMIAQHDPDHRFDLPAPVGGQPFLTQDEESSGHRCDQYSRLGGTECVPPRRAGALSQRP